MYVTGEALQGPREAEGHLLKLVSHGVSMHEQEGEVPLVIRIAFRPMRRVIPSHIAEVLTCQLHPPACGLAAAGHQPPEKRA